MPEREQFQDGYKEESMISPVLGMKLMLPKEGQSLGCLLGQKMAKLSPFGPKTIIQTNRTSTFI